MNMEGEERSLDTTGETPSKRRKVSETSPIKQIRRKYERRQHQRISLLHVLAHLRNHMSRTFRILPSTLVTCPLAAYGGSISPW